MQVIKGTSAEILRLIATIKVRIWEGGGVKNCVTVNVYSATSKNK